MICKHHQRRSPFVSERVSMVFASSLRINSLATCADQAWLHSGHDAVERMGQHEERGEMRRVPGERGCGVYHWYSVTNRWGIHCHGPCEAFGQGTWDEEGFSSLGSWNQESMDASERRYVGPTEHCLQTYSMYSYFHAHCLYPCRITTLSSIIPTS